MYNFGSFDAFIVKPTIMPDFARNLLHYNSAHGPNFLTVFSALETFEYFLFFQMIH